MIIENSDIEKQISKLKDNLINNNSNSNKRITNNRRIWSQNIHPYISNIIIDIDKYLKTIKKSRMLLNNYEEKNNNNKNKIEENKKSYTEKIIKRKEIKKKSISEFSKSFKNILNRIKNINNKDKKLRLMDGKSLKNISLNHNRTPKSLIMLNKPLKQKIRPTSASTFYDSKMFEKNFNKTSRNKPLKNKSSSYNSFREGFRIKIDNTKEKKFGSKFINLNSIIEADEKKGNIRRLNEIHRININRALKKFTPSMHLKLMKQIQVEDKSMKRNINNINEKINKKIKERCGGFYFKKKYERFISENKKNLNESLSIDSFNDKNNNKKRNSKILSLSQSYSSKTSYKPKINYMSKQSKKNENSERTDKGRTKIKKESFREISELLKYTLDIEHIHNFINSKYKFRNKNDINEDKKKYFSNLEEINKKLKGKTEDYSEVENKIFQLEELLSKDLVHNHKYIN